MNLWNLIIFIGQTIAPFIFWGIPLVLLWLAVTAIISYLQQIKCPLVVFEIKPPHEFAKMPFATQQWYSVLHGLAYKLKDFQNLFFQGQVRFAFEMVSTKEEGIVFYLACPYALKGSVFNTLQAQASECQIREVDHSPFSTGQIPEIEELKQTHHFAFPLKEHKDFDKDDPITYISGAMARAGDNECIGVQLIARPLVGFSERFKRNQADRIKTAIYKREGHITGELLLRLARLPISMLDLVILPSDRQIGPLPAQLPMQEKKIDHTPEEDEFYKNVHDKAGLPWFECVLRVYSSAGSPQKAKDRVRGVVSAFGALAVPGRQSLARKMFFLKQLSFFNLKHRIIPPLGSKLVLSVKELTDFYHLPYTPTVEVEGIKKVRAKELPAPLYFTSHKTKLSNVFAVNRYGGRETEIGLEKKFRRFHTSIIGGTGMGKTTLLLNMIVNDLRSGEGVGVIDPHGDLVEKILGYIPKNRIDDVVLFDPADRTRPLGFNFLELKSPVEKSRVCDELVSIFWKLYPEFMGPRSEHVLRNTILTVLELPNPVLRQALRLLQDAQFRESVAGHLNDSVVRDFWKKEFKGMGSRLKSDAIAPIQNKLGKFLTDEMTRNILNQRQSSFDIGQLMDEGKIFLANLAQGKIGEENSKFLGSLLVARFQLSVMRRVNVPEEKRKDFYLYVDEFQNFASLSFGPILSGARKYRLNLVMANQTLGQVPKQLQEIITSNVGLIMTFKTNNAEDADVLVPIFGPKIFPFDIFNLDQHKVYMKFLLGESSDSFSADTLPEPQGFDSKITDLAREHSRQQYGRDVKEVEEEMGQKMSWDFSTGKEKAKTKVAPLKETKPRLIRRGKDTPYASTE